MKNKVLTLKKTVPQATKLILRNISIKLSCGISFTANFSDTWTIQHIVDWTRNASRELCGGGVGGEA